jgi:hypothetical protein
MSAPHRQREDLQERAARARRHAREMTSARDRDNLLAYAEELELRAATLRAEKDADVDR